MREPVGPPADSSRASTSSFRAHQPPVRNSRDRDYDDDRRPLRSEPVPRDRVAEAGYRNPSAAIRDSRGAPRETRDEGWSRRPPPEAHPGDMVSFPLLDHWIAIKARSLRFHLLSPTPVTPPQRRLASQKKSSLTTSRSSFHPTSSAFTTTSSALTTSRSARSISRSSRCTPCSARSAPSS